MVDDLRRTIIKGGSLIVLGLYFFPEKLLGAEASALPSHDTALQKADELEEALKENPLDGLEELSLELKLEGYYAAGNGTWLDYLIPNIPISLRVTIGLEHVKDNDYKGTFMLDDFSGMLKILTLAGRAADKTIPRVDRPIIYESDMVLKEGTFRTKQFKRKLVVSELGGTNDALMKYGIKGAQRIQSDKYSFIALQADSIHNINWETYGCYQRMDFGDNLSYSDNIVKETIQFPLPEGESYITVIWNGIFGDGTSFKVADKDYDWDPIKRDQKKYSPITTTNINVKEKKCRRAGMEFNFIAEVDGAISETVEGDIFVNIHNSKMRIPMAFYSEGIMHFTDMKGVLTDYNIKYLK